MTTPDALPAGIDATKASAARMYDYYLGGTHNLPVDRELADQVIALLPKTPLIMRANRLFLRRAVDYCARAGVRQFLDLGAGIPTEGPVHEVARAVHPDARVVYVDNEEAATIHGREILRGDAGCGVVHADLRDAQSVLDHPETRRLIDFSEPVAVLLLSVLQFVPDEDDPAGVVAAYRDRLRPGSRLALSHATDEGMTEQSSDITAIYARSANPIRYRPIEAVRAMFAGFDLVEPGLTHIPAWRADPADHAGAPLLGRVHGAAGVGVKR
ncbi:SAM-dependent methyltransferase [Marinitenerispora sediminis]|uniref:Methyltransferase n=1 Tax=Marinitenerispora sediminis TaxID=1931232 RepID=A0A368TBZ1_9ACTN|nr:SAM-dependent methyltransferase [Marinitenerispora sediminis]RCV52079.1 hypothetical protein DEF28_14005 [Marinitenerispora sediminis]RCV58098.1 hypothetical protein DEF23_09650 [Marinitenerispora sediminis]RCV60840.1 hypothetical protein DEF24_05880 [Marinitenerispora sediminis]